MDDVKYPIYIYFYSTNLENNVTENRQKKQTMRIGTDS